MPWKQSTLDGLSTFLRESARRGQFVPGVWIESVDIDDRGGCTVRGCGWGLVAWAAGIMECGCRWTKQQLPPGSTGSQEVTNVLQAIGLTEKEIELLDQSTAWEHFDATLSSAYSRREEDRGAYILASLELAEFFISVLERVPVAPDEASFTRPSVLSRFRRTRLPTLKLPAPAKQKSVVDIVV